jgi:hypothetical protein
LGRILAGDYCMSAAEAWQRDSRGQIMLHFSKYYDEVPEHPPKLSGILPDTTLSRRERKERDDSPEMDSRMCTPKFMRSKLDNSLSSLEKTISCFQSAQAQIVHLGHR